MAMVVRPSLYALALYPNNGGRQEGQTYHTEVDLYMTWPCFGLQDEK